MDLKKMTKIMLQKNGLKGGNFIKFNNDANKY